MLDRRWTRSVPGGTIGDAPAYGPDPMKLFLAVIAASLLVGYVTGGRFRTFERLELRWWGLGPLGLALQAIPLPDGQGGTDLLVRVGVLSVSYVLLLLFTVANRRVAGIAVVAAGLAMNALVIGVNGGMPVSGEAVLRSGQGDVLRLLQAGDAAKHHLLTEDDRLTFLADVIPVPTPVNQAISVGDVLIYAGVAWLIIAVMRGRTAGLRPVSELPLRSYRGRHRRGAMAAVTPAPHPPAEATTSGT